MRAESNATARSFLPWRRLRSESWAGSSVKPSPRSIMR
jgi:hypothetical protein